MFDTQDSNSYRMSFNGRLLQKALSWISQMQFLPSHQTYNLSISNERRFIWFRNAKVGTRTFFSHFDKHHVHLSAVQAMNIYYLPNRFRDYFAFGFVRNPFDRLASAWLQMIANNNHFNLNEARRSEAIHFPGFISYLERIPGWMKNHHFKPQSQLMDLNNIDFLGRFETFTKDFTTVMSAIGVPTDDIPHKNRSGVEGYEKYYTPELRERVYRLYEKDFRIFYPDL